MKPGICKQCGANLPLDVHHKDKNRGNNKPANLVKLCRWCHIVADGRHSRRKLDWQEVRRQYFACFPRV